MVPGGVYAAVPIPGFSISLTDMTFERGSDLTAEAAAFGDQPALGLPGNDTYKYKETLTGDYAVTDTLPPSNEREFWQTFTQVSLNGVPFFTANQIVGPESQDDIWSAILTVTGLKPAQLAVLKAVLVNHNLFSTNGTFDYAYNPRLRRTIGRWARLRSDPTSSAPTTIRWPPSPPTLLTAQMFGP